MKSLLFRIRLLKIKFTPLSGLKMADSQKVELQQGAFLVSGFDRLSSLKPLSTQTNPSHMQIGQKAFFIHMYDLTALQNNYTQF